MTLAPGDILYADDLNRRGVRARRVANQSVANITASSISWDTKDEDTDAMLTPPSAAITIPFTGIWAITCRIDTALVASTRNLLDILPGAGTGTLPTGTPFSWRANWTSGEGAASVSATVALNAGNTIACSVYHTMGTAQNFVAWLQCFRVGA